MFYWLMDGREALVVRQILNSTASGSRGHKM